MRSGKPSSKMVRPEAADAGAEVEDARCVARARQGDGDAFGELVARHRSRVYRVALAMVGHHETAMDLSQDAFVRAYQSLPQFRGEAKFGTWLRRIVTNVCLDHLRKVEHRVMAASYEETSASGDDERHPGVLSAVAGSQEAPDAGVARKELGAAIVRALGTLSPDHRAALVLRELEGLSYEDIAAALDCAVGTVMSRLHYARKRLQHLLRDQYEP